MWKLAIRNVMRHRARTAMTLLAIVAGVVGLVLSGGFVHDIFQQLGETLIHSQTGHLQISRSGYTERGSRSPEKFLIDKAAEAKAHISADPEVTDVMGRLYFTGLLNNGRTDRPVIGEGVEPEPEARLGTGLRLVSGRPLGGKDIHAAMIGIGLARALKLEPGHQVTMVANTADGALNSIEIEIVGVFQTFSKDYDARAVRMPLAAAQELMNTQGINTLVVALHRTENTAPAAARLTGLLAPAGLEVKTWIELNDFYAKTVDMYDAQFGVLRIIILIMVLLSVANSVNMSTFERIGEFGTMRAMGNRNRGILQLVIAENAILGLVGAVTGTLMGIALALAISEVGISMPPPPNSDLGYEAHILVVPSVVAGAFLVGLMATILAALLPAWRLSRIPVVDALRQNI